MIKILYVNIGRITLVTLIHYDYSTFTINYKQVEELFSKIIGLVNKVKTSGSSIESCRMNDK